jgi:hypothetical protein
MILTNVASRGLTRRPTRGGCLLRLIMLLVIAGAVLALAWMTLLPLLFTRALQERTGFKADVASVSANPFTGRVTVRGLIVLNPTAFPVSDFLQLRSAEAELSVWGLWDQRIVFDSLDLDVRQLTLVSRRAGDTNIAAFRAALVDPSASTAVSTPLLIRRLRLRFDTLGLVDHAALPPRLHSYRLGLDQSYTDVTSLKHLFLPAVRRVLEEKNVTAALADYFPQEISGPPPAPSKIGENWLNTAERKTLEIFRGLRDKLEETRKP